MTDAAALLAAYDDQLRTRAEVPSADSVTATGPLLLATYSGGRGFITYRDLRQADGSPATAASVTALVAAAVEHFLADPQVSRVEWKTRSHDLAPGLHEALLSHGFGPSDPESVMIGDVDLLAMDVHLPPGVTIRRVHTPQDVARVERVAGAVFGSSPTEIEAMTAEVIARSQSDPSLQVWCAEAEGEIVTTGRLELVPGTEFAGIWGGSTLPQWRGRGIYRELTAARAREAQRLGVRWIHSDSTEFSRPILERSGLVTVTTTTPYTWRRPN